MMSRSSESRCWWWMKVVSSRQMELRIGRHASRAQSWWMVRWTAKCQMNVKFVLFREGWCDDSGMQVNLCCGSCKSSQPACSWFCDEPAASGAGAASGLRGTSSVRSIVLHALQCLDTVGRPMWVNKARHISVSSQLINQIRIFNVSRITQ